LSDDAVRREIIELIDSAGARLGTAFAISPSRFGTAAHVVTDSPLFMKTSDGTTLEAFVIALDHKTDLAVIGVDNRCFTGLALSESPPEVHQVVRSFGFPPIPGVDGVWATGEVLGSVDLDGAQKIQLRSHELTRGFSGAPVWSEQVGVIGVMSRFIKTNDELANRLGDAAFASPVARLSEMALENGVDLGGGIVPTPTTSVSRRALLERTLSIARCVARWVSVDVPVDAAQELAATPSVGAIELTIERLRQNKLTVLLGDFGSGKSLALERLLQRVADGVVSGSLDHSIIYVDARRQDVLEAELHRLHSVDTPFALFVDNADPIPNDRVELMLIELRSLSRSKQDALILVTSRPLMPWTNAAEAMPMPELSDAQARALIDRVAPMSRLPKFSDEFEHVLRRPLFALIAAAYFSLPAHFGKSPSVGDLLGFMTQRAYDRLSPTISSRESLLRRLACAQIDRSGDLVPIHEIVLTSERQAIINSGVVTYDEDRETIGLTLVVMAQWFAAQSLELSEISVADLASSEDRLERWRYPLLFFIASTSDQRVDELFEILCSRSPGFVATLLRKSAPVWFAEREANLPPALEVAKRFRRATLAWTEALGPLKQLSRACGAHGPASLGVRIEPGNRLTTAWYVGPDIRPDVFEIPANVSTLSPGPGYQSLSWRRVEVRPTWVWSQALGDIDKPLVQHFERHRVRIEGSLQEYEMAWQVALAAVGAGSLAIKPILISDFESSGVLETDQIRRFGGTVLDVAPLRDVARRLKADGIDTIFPPWPVRDGDYGRWVWSGFSEAALHARTNVIFTAALEAYTRIVKATLPKFAPRLGLFACLPVELRIIIRSLGEEVGYSPPTGTWYWIPSETGANRVIVETRLDSGASEPQDYARFLDGFARRPSLYDWTRFSFISGVLPLFGDYPISDLVFDWIKEDLTETFKI